MNYEKQNFIGERAQYYSTDSNYNSCEFYDGESPLKHSKNVKAENCTFSYKYPFWISENINVKDSTFNELGKSGLWYTKNFSIENTVIKAPKEFRRSDGIFLNNVRFENAAETMWMCRNIKLDNVYAKGDYFAMNSSEFYADNFEIDGNYLLDGGKNIEIHNSKIISKDAFWNCENVVVYDSEIIGEYLGWHSKNVKFVNCKIESDQGLCYIDGLTLENCTLINTPLAFEYSTGIDAQVNGKIESVKNPCGGKIKCERIGTLILNPKRCDVNATIIDCKEIEKTFSEDLNPNENCF
nr:DUF3737 family protein [uncultured Treponema sp.]